MLAFLRECAVPLFTATTILKRAYFVSVVRLTVPRTEHKRVMH